MTSSPLPVCKIQFMREKKLLAKAPAFKVEFSGEQVTLEISGEQTGDYPVVFL